MLLSLFGIFLFHCFSTILTIDLTGVRGPLVRLITSSTTVKSMVKILIFIYTFYKDVQITIKLKVGEFVIALRHF